MEKNQKIIFAVIAAVIVVAAAIGAVLLLNNNNSSETKGSIVGCYFDYSVKGDASEIIGNEEHEHIFTLKGTFKISILSETDTQYEVKYEADVYYVDENGARQEVYKNFETNMVDKSDYLKPIGDVSKVTINTYWGEKNCNKSSKTIHEGAEDRTITEYLGYDNKVTFEMVETGTTSNGINIIMIFMLKDTDYITKDKTDAPHTMSIKFDVSGYAIDESGKKIPIAGSMTMEYVDATSTCLQIKETTEVTMDGVPIISESRTKWSVDTNGGSSDIGTKTGTETFTSEKWGKLEVTVYYKEENNKTTTTLVYKDTVPVKISSSQGTPETQDYISMASELSKVTVDGKEVNNLDDLLKW